MKKLAMTLLGAAALGGAVIIGRIARARRRVRTQVPDLPDTISAVPAEVASPYDELVVVGLSAVDPQPLTEISGEGVDPDAVAAAHAHR